MMEIFDVISRRDDLGTTNNKEEWVRSSLCFDAF